MKNLEWNLTEHQLHLIDELDARQNMRTLENIVKGKTLADFQSTTLAFAAIVESCLISLDTGLGKTLVATGLINMLHYINPNTKWLLVVQNSNLGATYRKVSSGLYRPRAICSNAVSSQVRRLFLKEELMDYDVFIISYEALSNELLSNFFFEIKDLFGGIIVDESHTISNATSLSATMLKYMFPYARYRFLLTATPILVSPLQIINQIHLIDPELFRDVNLRAYSNQFCQRENGKIVGYKNLEFLRDDIGCRFVGATRRDLGLKGDHAVRILLCDPKPEYMQLRKMDTFKNIKGDFDGPAMQTFRDLIMDKMARGEKGLAYVNLNHNKAMLQEYFDEFDIRVGILDGNSTKTIQAKEEVNAKFSAGEYDILLTNITTGLDLQCDYTVFYELTYDFQQFLGRGERGLVGNDMDIIFILVKYTAEIEYFHDNMLARALMLETVSSKDVEDIKEAYAQLKRSEMLSL